MTTSQERLRSSLVSLSSRLVHSKPVYRTPVVFRWVLVCLALLGLGVYPASLLQRPTVVLSAFVCALEAIAAWSVWREARRAEASARPTLLAILVGTGALLVADASFAIFFGVLEHEPGRERLVVVLTRLPHVIAFACFVAAPVLFAGRRFFAIADPTHLCLGALLLTPLWLRFVLLDAVALADQDIVVGLVEIASVTAELVAALVSIALILDAITAHLALFHAGVLSLALADWLMTESPERWPLDIFWAAAIVVTCMTLVGDARTPDLQKRASATSNAPRTRRTVAAGLLIAAVITASLLVAVVGVPKVMVHAGTFATIGMAFVVVLAVLIAGFRHPGDTEKVMSSETTALARASVVIITNSSHTLRATAAVFGIPLEPIPLVRGRRYYVGSSTHGPIVLTQTPRIPNMDSLARIVAAVSDWQPKLVVIIGAARPLRPEVQPGDVILATELVELVDTSRGDDAPQARSMLSVAIKGPLLEAVLSAPQWTPSAGPVGFTRPPVFHRGRVACERKRGLSFEEDADPRSESVLAVELSGFGFGELTLKQLERIPTLMMCGVFPVALDSSWGVGSPEVEVLGDAVAHYFQRRLDTIIDAAVAVRAHSTDDPLAHASVFVSHRSSDAWFARELALRLSENGASVFLDEERPGGSAREQASPELKRASHVVVVGSGSMEGHPWFDARPSVATNKVILPILLDRQARSWVSMYFSGVAPFDFSTRAFLALEHSFARLLSALRARRWKPVDVPADPWRPRVSQHSLTRDLDALITGSSEVLDRWMAGRIRVEFIMRVLMVEADRLVRAERREGVHMRLYTIEGLLSVGEGEREANYQAVVDELEEMFAFIRAVKRNTLDTRFAELSRLARSLADVLATVASDPDVAKMLAKRAGFPPKHLPELKTAAGFWNDVVEQVLNGRSSLDALGREAAEQFPHNEQLRKLELDIGRATSRISVWE